MKLAWPSHVARREVLAAVEVREARKLGFCCPGSEEVVLGTLARPLRRRLEAVSLLRCLAPEALAC